MKDIKITNYTARDWLLQLLCLFAFTGLLQASLRKLIEGRYLVAALFFVGCIGWFLFYREKMKEFKKKNPQD